jgi:hypothetical protein
LKGKSMRQLNLEEIRRHILADDRGFYVMKGFYSPAEIDDYRRACDAFLKTGPVIQTRINSDRMPDYIHHRSHDRVQRTQRIYQFFHNHRHDNVGRFLRRAVDLRDEIESVWLDHPTYREEKERLQNYMIVTRYVAGTGMLPRHRDYDGPAPKPLIQFWVLLSEPEKDYHQGNLVLYARDGTRYHVESGLGVGKGDALIFDKSLEHEVEMTGEAAADALGRWTLLIGARGKRHKPHEVLLKRIAYHPWIYPATRAVKALRERSLRQVVPSPTQAVPPRPAIQPYRTKDAA